MSFGISNTFLTILDSLLTTYFFVFLYPTYISTSSWIISFRPANSSCVPSPSCGAKYTECSPEREQFPQYFLQFSSRVSRCYSKLEFVIRIMVSPFHIIFRCNHRWDSMWNNDTIAVLRTLFHTTLECIRCISSVLFSQHSHCTHSLTLSLCLITSQHGILVEKWEEKRVFSWSVDFRSRN